MIILLIFFKLNDWKSRKFSKINQVIKRDYLCQKTYCDKLPGFLSLLIFY